MKPVFGVANSNVIDLVAALKRLRPRTPVFVLSHSLSELPNTAKIVVAPSVASALKHRHSIEKTEAHLFIVDVAVNLKRVRGIELIDSKVGSDFNTIFYTLSTSILDSCLKDKSDYKHRRIKVSNEPLHEKMLERTPVSPLAKLLTMFYAIPNKKKRELYKTVIYYWLVTPSLEPEYLERTLNLKTKTALFSFLTSSVVSNLRLSFDKNFNARKVLKKNRISQFDYNYLNKVRPTLHKDVKKLLRNT